MMSFFSRLLIANLLAHCFSSALATRPLVLWHGLGDSHSSPGMLNFASLIQDIYPDIFIHSVYIEEDLDKDRKAGFYGNVNDQLDLVAGQLADIPELSDGFDAIGLSQGGQFLRAYVERYNAPQVNTLITFGSQHMGIAEIPACRRYDFLCQVARRAARGAIYSTWSQENLVQAQYFRDPEDMKSYLNTNKFLTSINNEIPELRNATYAKHLSTLENIVLVLFKEDKTVVPKESAWFGSQSPSSTDGLFPMLQGILSFPLHWWTSTTTTNDDSLIPMRLQPLYLEDWIGLQKLDKRGGVNFEVCNGEHMDMSDCWEEIVRKYLG